MSSEKYSTAIEQLKEKCRGLPNEEKILFDIESLESRLQQRNSNLDAEAYINSLTKKISDSVKRSGLIEYPFYKKPYVNSEIEWRGRRLLIECLSGAYHIVGMISLIKTDNENSVYYNEMPKKLEKRCRNFLRGQLGGRAKIIF